MLVDLPVHTRQSLYRCLDIISEPWLESEPEITWAKYTGISIELLSDGIRTCVNGHVHSIYDLPCIVTGRESSWFQYRHRLRSHFRHREKGPALILCPYPMWTDLDPVDREVKWICDENAYRYYHGGNYYFYEGELHRKDGPAMETAEGFKSYHEHGQWTRRTLS